MGVVGADGRVVVSSHSGYAMTSDQRHHFVRPWRIAHQVTEVENLIRILHRIVLEHRFERRKIRVDVADQGDSHQLQQFGPQQLPAAVGFVARTNAAMNRPSISFSNAATSSPASTRNVRASSTL